MRGLSILSGCFENGEISVDLPYSDIQRLVMGGSIVIIKNVFHNEKDSLISLRHAVFSWGQTVAADQQSNSTENCHCMQAGVSQRQGTPHIYHSYNFNRISKLPQNLYEILYHFFEPLRVFQNAITDNQANFEDFNAQYVLHPQIIHYPSGGGYLVGIFML